MTNEEYRTGGTPGVKEQARDKVAEAKERTAEQVESRLAQQKSRAASTLSDVAQSLLLSSQNLREHQQSNVSNYVERASEEVERLAHYLDERNVSDLVHEVEDLARRQPAVFVGGAIAVGFLAARFLKSSEPQQPVQPVRYPRDVYRGYDEPIPVRGSLSTDNVELQSFE